MKYSDMLKAIPTEYNGTSFKSRLEADMAYCLDLLKIEWEYEPKSFLLSNGKHYMPDFWLPKHKQWIEVKGKLTNKVYETLGLFSIIDTKANHGYIDVDGCSEIILLTRDVIDCRFYGAEGEYENLYLGYCSKCGSFFFCGNLGGYHCRACNNHEGDHDITVEFTQYGTDIVTTKQLLEKRIKSKR